MQKRRAWVTLSVVLSVGIGVWACDDPAGDGTDAGCPPASCDLPDGAVASCAMCPEPPEARPETMELTCEEQMQLVVDPRGDIRHAWSDWYAELSPEFDPMTSHHAAQAFGCDWQFWLAPSQRPDCDPGDASCSGPGQRASACRQLPVEIDDGVVRVHCGTWERYEMDDGSGSWAPIEDPSSVAGLTPISAQEWATTVRITVWPSRDDAP